MNRMILAVLGIVVVVAGLLAYGALFTVEQTRQALVLQFGNPVKTVTTPGLKFKLPFIQQVEYYDRWILDLD
ncbi:MAG: protease modulator HflC, partial [Rhodospirillales bacterium]|nr:protease modulator HflC [Rhodospirillales bacterium]